MKKSFLLIMFICYLHALHAQNSFKVIVKDSATQHALQGVTITNNDNRSAITDINGYALISNIQKSEATFNLKYVGYMSAQLKVKFPDTSIHIVLLAANENTLQDVTVVSSTRNNEPIENATSKVEVLGIEEMNEESTLKPGNIASILGDMSGIQVQQSSVVSGNSNVRIQGLDSKYTQILRDGMPLYEGYSGGFGILSIPPLDLQQIELIKGAASTLYGGGAIGGLINLISKKPAFKPDASFLVNQTTLKETNINAYYAQRWKHIGFTLFAGQNFQKQVDVNKDGLSDVPHINGTLIHPTLFIYPSAKSYISLSWSGSFEKRLGGDMLAINNKADSTHAYFEKDKLDRNTFSLIAENRFTNYLTASVKASLSLFSRNEVANTFNFDGRQNSFNTEASLTAHLHAHNLVSGINITGDVFKPSSATPVPVGDFSNTTLGVFMQDNWQVTDNTKLEAGLRFDHHFTYGDFILPRLALFHHFNKQWGTRLGFGMGYKTPNPLVQQIKDYDIINIQPIANTVSSERSVGVNAEVNYRKTFGAGNSFFINHAFFITRVGNPIVANESVDKQLIFMHESKPVITKGFDTYVQMKLNDYEFYLGYTYTDAVNKYLPQNNFVLITPRNRAAFVTQYTIEGKWRFGVEGSYTGIQHRKDYSKTPAYLLMAAMIERKFGAKWSLVLNCENLLDARQSRHESLYTGSITNPDFKALWAPIDGRVLNLSLRFQPFEN